MEATHSFNQEVIEGLTPSERKVLDGKLTNKSIRVLDVARAVGGWLLITVERPGVRKTKKHQPPFRYSRQMYGKRGARLQSWSGNIWEDGDIIDDFAVSKASHRNGYSNK